VAASWLTAGHLDPEGYTAFLIQELHRYGPKDRPLRIYLAGPEHRVALDKLRQQQEELGLYGEIVYLDPDGNPINSNRELGATPSPVADAALVSKSLTALRRFMVKDSQARILLGGRRAGFQGALPGVVEEALVAREHRQPLYLVGAWGRHRRNVRALGVDNGAWLPALPDAVPDDRLAESMAELRAIAAGSAWRGLNNGLTDAENRLLAATPRPTEIAALVSLGLGRRFSKSTYQTRIQPPDCDTRSRSPCVGHSNTA
jgi:hypothetical protein